MSELLYKRRRSGERLKNMRKTFLRLFSYFKYYKTKTIITVLAILGSAFATVAGSYFLKPILNNYILPLIGHKNPDLSGFIRVLMIMALIFTGGALCTLLYNRIVISISNGIIYRIRTDMFTYMQTLPLEYFDKHTHGQIMSCFSNDIDALRQLLSQSLPQLVSLAISITGVFLMMLFLSPILTLLVIITLCIMLIMLRIVGGKSSKYFKEQQEILGEVNGYIEEMIEGQNVIKTHCREDIINEEFDERCEELCKSSTLANAFGNVLMPIVASLSYLQYTVTAVVGGFMAVRGLMDIGTIASFLQYTRSFSHPVTQISQQINYVLMALAGAERIFDMLDEQSETDDGDVTLVNIEQEGNACSDGDLRKGEWAWKVPLDDGQVKYVPLRGNIKFENVTFSYDDGNDNTVLYDISFEAEPGMRIAFVGSRGSGKTTIINLLSRFYDVSGGEILYDGINIKNIKKSDLRRSVGVVKKDSSFFSGTVMENIRYGNLNASDEQVIAAAKLANADAFISHLPEGYQTVLTSHGMNLSHGQRQLIAIARAMITDAPVIIFDQSTSSVDARTEQSVDASMGDIISGKTVLISAYRPAAAKNADLIIVIDKGRIIEQGNHDRLIEQRGRYYELFTGMADLE